MIYWPPIAEMCRAVSYRVSGAVKIKEKPKLYTPSPILLMSCVYFDLNRTGYLQDTDVEQVIHMLGLRLSRAQVTQRHRLPAGHRRRAGHTHARTAAVTRTGNTTPPATCRTPTSSRSYTCWDCGCHAHR